MNFYESIRKDLQERAQKEGDRFWHDAGHYMITDGYSLSPDSLVIDVGGYKGAFTDFIVRKYDCYVDVYEPVRKFYNEIKERFSSNRKVCAINCGLEDRSYIGPIAGMDDASSMVYPCDSNAEQVTIVDAAVLGIKASVDLIAINGEGCEYPVLERLIQTDQIINYKNILIQFHYFVPDAENRRNEIRNNLRKTHNETFCYEFCWEAWSAK